MTYMVPFDGSKLSEAALLKARLHAIALSNAPPGIRQEVIQDKPFDVIAVSVVPESARYAREMDWITEDEDFRSRVVIERLHQQVTDLDPSAEFQFFRVDGAATSGTISARLREKADEIEPDLVFVGSENAGRIITPITSVAGGVTAKQSYDVCIIRNRLSEPEKHRIKTELSSLE